MSNSRRPGLSSIVGAVGIVYGDIGTSPLYALQQAVGEAGTFDAAAVRGVLSLIFWALAISVTLKYLTIIMRADNEGEGGILALFALKPIRKGTRVLEYLGDRVSHKEADARYEAKTTDDNHTFLFIVDRHLVIDGGVKQNAARFINHGCDPNCESVIENRRVFIEAVRRIEPGEELTYDYQIQREADDPPDVDAIFACRCGSERCRGSMLWPPRRTPAAQPTARR